MIFKNYYSKEGIPSQGCVWNVYGMILNSYCFKEGILSQGCVLNVYGMIFNNYCFKEGILSQGVCGMYMEWYLTIICLRLSECCWIILRQSWGDYSPIFTSASVLLNGEHNFWQGIGTLVISNKSNNFFLYILPPIPGSYKPYACCWWQ